MASLQIRDLPGSLYDRLVARARQERRSIAQEATMLLAVALEAPVSHKERRNRLLSEMKGVSISFENLGTPEEVIRRDRDR